MIRALYLALLATGPNGDAASAVPVVAVFDVAVDGKTAPNVSRKLTDQLRVELAATKRVIVVDRGEQEARLRELLREQKEASYKPCVDEACQIPLGKELAAKQIVRPMLSRFGDRTVFSAELIEVSTGGSAGGASVETGASEGELLDAVQLLARRLTGVSALEGGSGETVYVGPSLGARVQVIGGKTGAEDGIVRFESEPAGLAVFVDGRKLAGVTPLDDFLPLGKRKVRAEAVDGARMYFVPHEEDVELKAGMVVSMRLEAVRGELVVVARDAKGLLIKDVTVLLDGKAVAKAPVRLKGVDIGEHVVVLETEEGAKATKRFSLKSNDPVRLEIFIGAEPTLDELCSSKDLLCEREEMLAFAPEGAKCRDAEIHGFDDWRAAAETSRARFCDRKTMAGKGALSVYRRSYERCLKKIVCARETETIEKLQRTVFR